MKKRKLFLSVFVFLFVLFFSSSNYSQSSDSGFESIKSDDLLLTVKTLCSKEFDGRLPGSEGYNKAVNFAAEKFSQLNILPAGDDGLFQ